MDATTTSGAAAAAPEGPGRSDNYGRLLLALAELGHPARLRILILLRDHDGGGKLSPKDLAAQMGVGYSLGTVAYHVRAMHDDGLLRRAGQRQVRGAVQHFYALSRRGEQLLDDLQV